MVPVAKVADSRHKKVLVVQTRLNTEQYNTIVSEAGILLVNRRPREEPQVNACCRCTSGLIRHSKSFLVGFYYRYYYCDDADSNEC